MKKFNEFYSYEDEIASVQPETTSDMGQVMNMLGQIQEIPAYADNSSMEPAYKMMKDILDKYMVDSTLK